MFCDGTNQYCKNVEGDYVYTYVLTKKGLTMVAEH